MASIDTLEKARVTLQSNQRDLRSAIEDSETQLEQLEEEKCEAKEAVKAAKSRLKKLKKLSKTICNDCWVILPALFVGRLLDYDEDEHQPSTGSSTVFCVSCGGNISQGSSGSSERSQATFSSLLPSNTATATTRTIKFPSSEATSRLLDGCKHARIQSKKILNGQRMRFRLKEQQSNEDENESSDVSISSSSSNDDSEEDGRSGDHIKSACLNVIRFQHTKAKDQLECIETAIEKWSKNKELLEIELDWTRKSLEKVVAKERVRLEGRLLTLGVSFANMNRSAATTGGGSGRGRDGSDSDNYCGVCWEPPEQKIAFQCGHQCCSDCAKHLRNCHICRGRIRQRIPLYDC